ncbi:T9SS type A sorting domain-containing protein [Hymenobacter aquaticus]|uniref:T9SS type A sorting domain-containing protein n=1 Tax=Hymenobacter aquaticus TaxID=1867101 RepID=UPI0014368874|nr:T9SS type A sorting domain-containing protein [Hymenobacter aquaticus]
MKRLAAKWHKQRAVRVYLDANNDGTFSTSELWTSGIVSPTAFSRTLPLPPGAVLNVPLRLRILTDSNFLGTGPCTVTRGQYLDFSVTITNGPLGTVRPKDSANIYVAPNPADDTFLLHYAVPQGKTMLLTVTNSTGQTILVGRLRSTAGQQLQLSAKELSLPSGLYLLRLEVEGNVQTCKLLVAP